MRKDFVSSGRAVSDMKAHLVLTTKYRRNVLTALRKYIENRDTPDE
jgi:putative transposase